MNSLHACSLAAQSQNIGNIQCLCLHSVTCALLLASFQKGMTCGEVKSHLCHVEACVAVLAVCAVSGGWLEPCCKQLVQILLLSDLGMNSASLVCISLCLYYRQKADVEQQLQQERQHLFTVAQAVQIANSHQLTVNAAMTQCKDQIGAGLHRLFMLTLLHQP